MVSKINHKNVSGWMSELNQLIQLGIDVVRRGLVVGSGGNLSIRVPNTDTFYISATGTELNQLDRESFVLMNLDGKVLSEGISPSSEFRVHLESYRARPDAFTCIHLHPQASVLSASLDLNIQFLTIDHVYYLRKITRIPWIQSGSVEIGEAVAIALRDSNIIILENHGCVVLAPSVKMGLARALNLEEAAELTLRCQQLGISATLVPQAYWDYLEEKNL